MRRDALEENYPNRLRLIHNALEIALAVSWGLYEEARTPGERENLKVGFLSPIDLMLVEVHRLQEVLLGGSGTSSGTAST